MNNKLGKIVSMIKEINYDSKNSDKIVKYTT